MKIKKQAGQQRARIDRCENTHGAPACLVELKYGRLSTRTLTLTQRSYKGKTWESEVSMHPQAPCHVQLFRQGSFDDSVDPKYM